MATWVARSFAFATANAATRASAAANSRFNSMVMSTLSTSSFAGNTFGDSELVVGGVDEEDEFLPIALPAPLEVITDPKGVFVTSLWSPLS